MIVTHAFVSPKAEQTDPTIVGPNEWNASHVITGAPYTYSADFNFCTTPGTTISIGNNSVVISPAPIGVNSTSINNAWLYISDGANSEPVKITGFTAGPGAACTVVINATKTHSGSGWQLCSATSGIQEAVLSQNGNATCVTLEVKQYSIHAPIYMPLTCRVSGQAMFASSLNIAADFAMSGLGVFVFPASGGNGPQVDNLQIVFIQPDSTNLATYTHWPPAFYAVGCGRFKIKDIMMFGAFNCINMTGNTGGSSVENFQAACYDVGINIDGAQDSVYLINTRFWPYGATANQAVAYNANGQPSVQSGRCDDLHITDFLSDSKVGLYFYAGSSGNTIGHLTNITLDSISELIITNGYLDITNLYISTGTFDHYSISVSSPTGPPQTYVRITNMMLYSGSGVGTAQPWIYQSGGDLIISNSSIQRMLDHPGIIINLGLFILTGCTFFTQNVVYANPIITVRSGARANIIGNEVNDNTNGATFISVAADDYHQIRANVAPGWVDSYPTTNTHAMYETGANILIPGLFQGQSYTNVTYPTAGVYFGVNSPAGVVSALRGSIYLNVNGAAGTVLWVKESGDNTTAGWVGK